MPLKSWRGLRPCRSFALVTAGASLRDLGCLTAKALTSARRGLCCGGWEGPARHPRRLGCVSAGLFPKHPEGSPHLQGSAQMSSRCFRGQCLNGRFPCLLSRFSFVLYGSFLLILFSFPSRLLSSRRTGRFIFLHWYYVQRLE